MSSRGTSSLSSDAKFVSDARRMSVEVAVVDAKVAPGSMGTICALSNYSSAALTVARLFGSGDDVGLKDKELCVDLNRRALGFADH